MDEDSELNSVPKRQKSIQRSIAVLASAVDDLQVVQATKPVDPRPNHSSAATVKASNTTNSALQRIQTRQEKGGDSE